MAERGTHMGGRSQVADSLLLWLKALPSPVIPCRLFRAFLGTQRTSCQAESLAELHLLFLQVQPAKPPWILGKQ